VLGGEPHLEKAFGIAPRAHALQSMGRPAAAHGACFVGGAAPESVEDPRDAAVQSSPPPPAEHKLEGRLGVENADR